MSNSKSIHLSRNKNIPGTTIFRRNDSIPPWKDLSAVFNALDDYLFVLDQEANIIFCNENVFEQLGYSKKDLIGENLIKVHPAQLQEEVASSLSDMLTGKEKLCNVPLLTKNGKEIPVETRIISWNWEGMDVLIGISRNISERLAYEHQIRENSERLQMALLATDAGLWDWDIKTGNLVFNEKWFALRGYDSFELENKYETWKSQVYPDDQKNVLLMLNKHLHHGTPFYQAEYRTKHKNGDYIWILDTGRVTEYDVEGKPVRMVGTNIDINDKKQSELLLKQNLRQQELLSEIALEINSLESFSSRISSILKKIGEHTGVSRVYIFENKCETTSNTFEWCNHGVTPQINDLQEVPFEAIPSWISILNEYGVVYSENIAELPEDLKIVLEPQGIKSIIVYPLTVKKSFFGFIGFDECVRPKHWTKCELELLRTVSGIIANAFERKLSEQSLKKSEAKNRALLESIPDILFLFDSDGTIRNFQSGARDELAFPPQEFLHRSVYDIFPAEFAQEIVKAINDTLQNGQNKIDYSIPVKDKITDFEARMSRMNESQVIAIVRNVSERKNYERQLTAERDRADRANKAKSEFLANMSHEIRTPMNAILGFSEALYYKTDQPQYKKMLKSILTSGNLLLSLLNDILDLSKIEAGKLQMEYQPMSLKNLLDEIKNLFIHKIDLKKLDFNVQVQPGFPDAVMLDEIHIKQVIFNLVGNAIKFTHAGYIRLSISHQMVSEDEADITFAVADSGIGIPKSQHVRIFEAFTQQPGHSNPNFGGVGLGLAITKRLVDKMGGSINLESEKGRGSEFTVMLPGIKICDVALKSSEMQHYHTSAIRFNPATMLVIDDVSSNIDAVESMLSDSGLKIMRAETAEIGLELLNQNKPDIILLDIRLPGMDGFEMAKKIKNNPDTKNIPVLAFTASVFSLDRLNKASGFDGVLFKPVSIHMLNNGLKKFLRYVEPVMGKTLQKAGNNFFSMSLLTRENISTVQKTIDEELLPQWEKLKDSFVLYKIDSFIARLAGFSKKYQIESFAAYAQQLEEDMEIVDLESLQHNLRKFPEITNELKRYISDNLM